MVGVINANDSTPISNQIGLAREADFMLLPGEKWPTEAQQASMASLAATATTATFTVTETPNEAGEYYPSSSADGSHGHLDEHSNDLSTGAVAGIAVGSVVVALAGVGLLLLMLRTRKLKKRLDEQQAAQNQQNQQGPPLQGPMAAYPHASPWPTQQRQMSQLPPYQSHDAGADMYKHPDSDLYDVPSRSMSPLQQGSPYSAQGQQFMAFRPGDPRNRCVRCFTHLHKLDGADKSCSGIPPILNSWEAHTRCPNFMRPIRTCPSTMLDPRHDVVSFESDNSFSVVGGEITTRYVMAYDVRRRGGTFVSCV